MSVTSRGLRADGVSRAVLSESAAPAGIRGESGPALKTQGNVLFTNDEQTRFPVVALLRESESGESTRGRAGAARHRCALQLRAPAALYR